MASPNVLKCQESLSLPHRENDTAVIQKVLVPENKCTLFLALHQDELRDKISDELGFNALPKEGDATFQYLLYLTYCYKGALFQITLENPDFSSMSMATREDFSHGYLFCFVLDLGEEENAMITNTDNNDEYNLFDSELTSLTDLTVFRRDIEVGQDQRDEFLNDAFSAFMRLQLVRIRATSLANAMIVMRDTQNQLKDAFEWVDLPNDSIHALKVSKKRVRDLNGSMFGARQYFELPSSIKHLNLKSLEKWIGKMTDSITPGKGKNMFFDLMSKLLGKEWYKHRVVRKYNTELDRDLHFLEKVKEFAGNLELGCESTEVDSKGLIIFQYSLETLINIHNPCEYRNSLIHRHVPVSKPVIDKVLQEIKTSERMAEYAMLLNSGKCYCQQSCLGDCQIAYSCFYNASDVHPFVLNNHESNQYLGQLYPHLAKLERLSNDMKVKYTGSQFESIADLVFHVLTKSDFGNIQPLYRGLSQIFDCNMINSSFSLGQGSLLKVYQSLCFSQGFHSDYPESNLTLNPVKVYDHALVRHLFSDTLQIDRLFQASATFNYIISNTAPRYTKERIMHFHLSGPGQGKTFANQVINCQFAMVEHCIETLTSFTPQAFKYKDKRTASVVLIDDGHICHERSYRGAEKETQVIPNTFKNLLDTSLLESDVVLRDGITGKASTVKYRSLHNCGFVWNTNSLSFVSDAWADRCLIIESEYGGQITRTRSTRQIQDTVTDNFMDKISALCLYRQNFIQTAVMISDANLLQFSVRFDKARNACINALLDSHILCVDRVNKRAPFCINQIVFSEAMKLACHFVFDLWIPPWTDLAKPENYSDLQSYMNELNTKRLHALNELSFGQIALEILSVYKLCCGACLPDICPRILDKQARFGCKVLGYVFTQIQHQNLKTQMMNGKLHIKGIDTMCFAQAGLNIGKDEAHELLKLCSHCEIPARTGTVRYKLCSYTLTTSPNGQPEARGLTHLKKKVATLIVPQEALYDLLAIFCTDSHSAFWNQMCVAMVTAYERGVYEQRTAFGQYVQTASDSQRLAFTLNLEEDPLQSLIIESTASIKPLHELKFVKCFQGGKIYQCTASIHYAGVLAHVIGNMAPQQAFEDTHLKEATVGPKGSFHGPRLSVYSSNYSGVPVKNLSSFCNTRTVYYQDRIYLTLTNDYYRVPLIELEEDWEWRDAVDVLNHVHGDVFSVAMLKSDYAVTIIDIKGDAMNLPPINSSKLTDLVHALNASNGQTALQLRRGVH